MPDRIDDADEAFDAEFQRFVAGRLSPAEEAAFRAAHARAGGDPKALDAYRTAFRALAPSGERVDFEHGWAEVAKRIAPAARRTARRRSSTAGLWRIAATITIAASLGGVWMGWSYRHRSPAVAVAMRTMLTARGESESVTLSDGTKVVLGPASTLQYPSVFDARSRELAVDGEAYLDVAHDPTRPLRVRAGATIVEDVGTTFVVRSYAGDAATQVVVASGRVALHDAAFHRLGPDLVRGELGTVSNGAMTVRAVDPAPFTAWTQGRLVFENVSVADVLSELSRWFDVDLATIDATLAARRVTATFTRGSADAMLDGLASVLDAHVVRNGRRVQLVPTGRGQ